MEFNNEKFDNNEKIIFNVALGVLLGALVVFGLAVLILRNYEFLESTLSVIAGFGMAVSAVIVIYGNVRLVRFIIIIKNGKTEVNVWKSAISIAFGLMSLVIYWFILIMLVLSSF